MHTINPVPSRYLVEHETAWDGTPWTVLFHSLNRGLKILEPSIWRDFQSGRMDGRHRPLFQELCEMGFLVSPSLDETRLLSNWRYSRFLDTRSMTFKIQVTEACNLRCVFCIQEGMKGPVHMSDETSRRCAALIEELIESRRPDSIKIMITGGEPLLNFESIQTLGALVHFCRGRGVDVEFSLTTNGVLLDRSTARNLSRLGMHTVRVSLFGPPDLHDRHRVFEGGRGSYDLIERNLVEASEFLTFRPAIQYDEDTSDYLRYPELFDRLLDVGLGGSVHDMEFGALLPRELDFDRRARPDCSGPSRPDIYFFLEQEARKRGFRELGPPPSVGCLANRRGSLVIDVNGNLISCPGVSHEWHPELTYGNVYRGVDFTAESQIIAPPLPDGCGECSLAGLCDGGCRQQALVGSGTFHGVFCSKEYLESVIRQYMEDTVIGYLKENAPRFNNAQAA